MIKQERLPYIQDMAQIKIQISVLLKIQIFSQRDFKQQLNLFNLDITDDFLQEGQEVEFQFWDLSYKYKRFSCYPTTQDKGCSVIIILYDITNRESFEKVFLDYNNLNFKNKDNLTTLFLVGNKCDLEEKRQVSYKEGKQLSESLGMLFIEVSVKKNYQVKELFEILMHKAFNFN